MTAIVAGQFERENETTDGIGVGCRAAAAFQASDRVHAQASPLGENFLRQTGRAAMCAQQATERLAVYLTHTCARVNTPFQRAIRR